jgi:hypothetical protein
VPKKSAATALTRKRDFKRQRKGRIPASAGVKVPENMDL